MKNWAIQINLALGLLNLVFAVMFAWDRDWGVAADKFLIALLFGGLASYQYENNRLKIEQRHLRQAVRNLTTFSRSVGPRP